MSLKKVLMLSFAALAAGGSLSAQNLIVGADFATRFDNREYANNDFNESQTLFSARFTPRIGVEWMEKNRLIFGVDLLQNFGQHNGAREPFLSDVKPLIYYQFNSKNVQANAGIFDRKELLGDYSRAFFSDSTAFYHNRLSGFLGHYKSTERENTYVEMAIDWEGMYSEQSREMFRIISAGRYTLERGFYFGYAFSMFHFAGSKLNENVTDNLLVNPYAGWGFNAFFDFDIKAGFLFAPQRGRSVDHNWKKPCGAQIDFVLTKWGVKLENNLKCNLRFDDTNPVKEDVEYVDSIKRDIRWLGFDWALERYASDYFDQLYDWAVVLIKKGLAYVDDQTQEEIRLTRGTVSEPGKESPWRNRSVEENLDLFERMKKGEFADGEKVLRAKIDMAHPNMLFRDPIMYRILHAEHHRTGNKWCIYPMYDYAHGQCDSIERITHSICTLEFDVHRPLYDWFIQALDIYPSHQYEFARLNLTYTMMSKRRLLKLVQEGAVMGWDDPRMPTICALRRKGYTPASVRNFAEMVGVAKRDNVIDLGKLEFCVREDLNKVAERRMAVLNPLKVVITNYPEGKTELFTAINNPEDENAGTRQVPFSREIYIERDDFMEVPPKKYYRLSPGTEVRLRYSYLIRCEEVVKDAEGNITELRCTYDPESGNGSSSDGRRVKGVIHWVSAADAIEAEIRLFNPLFTTEDPDDVAEGGSWEDNLNPDSMIVTRGYLEPSLGEAPIGQPFQFERVGSPCGRKNPRRNRPSPEILRPGSRKQRRSPKKHRGHRRTALRPVRHTAKYDLGRKDTPGSR